MTRVIHWFSWAGLLLLLGGCTREAPRDPAGAPEAKKADLKIAPAKPPGDTPLPRESAEPRATWTYAHHPTYLCFSPDGKRLFAAGGFFSALTVWDVATGAAQTSAARLHDEPLLSPDGDLLALE